jgi:hypothetical protein
VSEHPKRQRDRKIAGASGKFPNIEDSPTLDLEAEDLYFIRQIRSQAPIPHTPRFPQVWEKKPGVTSVSKHRGNAK